MYCEKKLETVPLKVSLCSTGWF